MTHQAPGIMLSALYAFPGIILTHEVAIISAIL